MFCDIPGDESLEIEDRITLSWDTTEPALEQVFDRFGELMAGELLVVEMSRREGLGEGKAVKVGDGRLQVSIEKTSV